MHFIPQQVFGNLDQAFQATYSEVFRAVAQEYNGTVICQRKQKKG